MLSLKDKIETEQGDLLGNGKGNEMNVDFTTLNIVSVFLALVIGSSIMKPEFLNVRKKI